MASSTPSRTATQMLESAAATLIDATGSLPFTAPVACVYHPLRYAWEVHQDYLRSFGAGRSGRILFLGMNPGPFGMVQTGVPFGEVAAVRDWMGLKGHVQVPAGTHPRRPVQGFDCRRSEVSGRRLWGLFKDRFKTPQTFFRDHFVVNHVPLAFVDGAGRNLTPDKLRSAELDPLLDVCDAHLRQVAMGLDAAWVVGVGDFAATRAREALDGCRIQIGRILHPSPANPRANRDWAGEATRQLVELGIW